LLAAVLTGIGLEAVSGPRLARETPLVVGGSRFVITDGSRTARDSSSFSRREASASFDDR